jgi:Zn-dependent protease
MALGYDTVLGGGSSIPLFRIAGFRIGVHPSWFLVLFLWIAVLQDSFASVLGSDSQGFTAAVLAAFAFFGSIVLHELGHAFAARREGIGVAGIDLFFFGGFMKATRDSDTPGEEFRVAAAGPAVTLLIAVVAAAIAVAMSSWSEMVDAATLQGGASDNLVEVLVSFTVSMNVILLVFNLIPAFPLDGGRIARAAVWRFTGDRHGATRVSAFLGQAFAVLLIGYGAYKGFSGSDWAGAIWYFVLGWILGGAARQAVAASTFATRLEGVTAEDIMDAEPVTIPASLPVERAYDEFFLRYQGWPWFAVVEDDGRFAGLAHREAVEHAALSGTAALPVRSVLADGEEVSTDTPLEALIGSEPLRRLGALMAVDAEGRLRGVVTLEQVSRALQARLAPS